MVLANIVRNINKSPIIGAVSLQQMVFTRAKTSFRSGALKPMPETRPSRLFGVFCTVVPGLLIGAAISKYMANFLEENDLFVPSDDDDDDD